MEHFHPIGTPGQPWTKAERRTWFEGQEIKRSFADEVLARLEDLDERLTVDSYGSLSIDPTRYPLMRVRTRVPRGDLPWVLVTGGVHGYETSGVQGALAFLRGPITDYLDRVNFLVAPCVSPWGYEVVHRWNPSAVDPNRSFVADSPAEESHGLMAMVDAELAETGARLLMHVDLHETTDSDETEFRPALAARDGEPFEPGVIPDGFYLVADSAAPHLEFQRAIIAAVEAVTHIAPPDAQGNIIGSKVVSPGVIEYPFSELGLCAGLSSATYKTTTEVYPDSPKATPEVCNAAQVAAVRGALDHVLAAVER